MPDSYIAYLRMLEDVFAECVRKLEPGGRIAVNVANLGRRPYRSLSAGRGSHHPTRPRGRLQGKPQLLPSATALMPPILRLYI